MENSCESESPPAISPSNSEVAKKFLYTIVSSQVLRPNSDFNVSLTIHDSNGDFDGVNIVRVSIEDSDNSAGFKIHQNVELKPNETVIANIPIGDIPVDSHYMLLVKNISGMELEHKATLIIEKPIRTILIQSDKAIYKPNDCIKYRVFVLDCELKAATINDKELNICITDASKTLLKQLNGVTTVNGVFCGDYQLSDAPSFGDWQIKATIGDQVKTFKLQVAEYVLPKFTVEIESPDYFIRDDEKFSVSIRAKYTNGKSVRGTAAVSVAKKNMFRTPIQAAKYDKMLTLKTVAMNGKVTVEFDVQKEIFLPSDLGSRAYLHNSYEIRAEFMETLAGSSQKVEKAVTVYEDSFKIISNANQLIILPHITVCVTVSVRKHDDSLIEIFDPDKKKISIYIKRDHAIEEMIYDLDKNGNVQFNINIGDEQRFSFGAAYCKKKTDLYDFNRDAYEYFKGKHIFAKVEKKSRINEEVVVMVASKSPLQSYTYVILAKRSATLIEAKTITPTYDDLRSHPPFYIHKFTFVPDFNCAPQVEIIVYFIKDTKIKSTFLSVKFKGGDFANFIELDVTPNTAKPGQMVDISIKTNPNAYVGLLGVDKSVKLLGSGNDLTSVEIWKWANRPIRRYGSYRSPWDHFLLAELITFTNLIEPEQHAYYFPNLSTMGENRRSMNEDGIVHVSLSYCSHNVDVPYVTPVIRKEFPDTWIWETIEDKSSRGLLSLRKKVPDSLTTWVLTGFSIDPVNGLALTKQPSELCVQQQFHISIHLPYSVKRGEVVTIPCSIFNYLPNEIEAEIILENEHKEFEFVDSAISNEIYPEIMKDKFRKKKLTIRSEDALNALFTVRPIKVGLISFKVSALSTTASDCVIKTLKVECEGVPHFVNKAVYVDLNKTSQIEPFNLSIDIPKISVPDSTRIEILCVGDLLGGTIKNFEKLIRLPTGCGEQNMMNFVPNIVILDYLTNSHQLTAEVEGRAKKFMEIGYQRELSYKHKDGSFSAFGESDESGSTWLTAFVARSFRQASNRISVHGHTIDEALKWLSTAQSADGSFPEKGSIFHKEIQSGSSNGIALTAYVLTAFLVNHNSNREYEDTIQRALQNITDSIDKCSDIYALAVSAYALQLANHRSKKVAIDRLLEQVQSNGNHKWWDKSFEVAGNRIRKSKAINVEITAYALLTLQLNGQDLECLPIVKWLLSQRNDRGGFEGTQDTIVGIEALAIFASKFGAKDSDLKIDISTPDGPNYSMVVNKGNSLVLQSQMVSPDVQSVTVNASGKGFAVFELAYQYNIETLDLEAAFTLTPIVTLINEQHMSLQITTAYLSPKGKDTTERSNMVVLEITLPSGFVVHPILLDGLKSSHGVIKRIERTSSDTVAVLYFDHLDSNPVTLKVDGFREHLVEESKPASIWIYDYYDNALSAREFYSLPSNESNEIAAKSEKSEE
ncbi:CD109 antigen-like [Bradysia coprophila]|uniref:CD109 antigen-like n=1 Tax=Bradysia coprophila TaxID=38358 RepID=UPI00187D9721|nr:CD109 antigen-like [Bradysia coprophila]